MYHSNTGREIINWTHWILPIIFLIFFTEIGVAEGTAMPEEGRIYQLAQDAYVPARPKRDWPQPILVDCMLNLLQILALDGKSQVFTLNANLLLKWTDEYLVWNLTEIPADAATLPASLVWTPDIAITNSMGDVVSSQWRYTFPVAVAHNGPDKSCVYWSI